MNDELKSLIQELFSYGGIGVRGVSNDYGADSYECPACGAWKHIKGYAHVWGSISDVDHKPDCQLVKLWEMTR